MAQTNDTIDGLLAEFRGYSAGMPPSYHVTMSWADFRKMLDRLDAARKRMEWTHKKELETRDAVIQTEVAAREAEREAHKREIDEIKKQVGNAAHLRAACVAALAELKRCHKCHDARLHFVDIVHVGNAKNELETAIASPERNCDLFNFDDAEENARAAWDAFDGTLELNMAELSPREYAIVKECMAAFRWLFSHYKRQSESAKKALAATEKEGCAK